MPTATKSSSTANAQSSTKGDAMRTTTQIISSNKEKAVNDSAFNLKAWEQKLYVKEQFSAFVDEKQMFELWREGTNFSEVAFQNYQHALLSVLQHIYCYAYKYHASKVLQKFINNAIARELKVFEARDTEVNEGSTFFGKGGLSQKLVKIAFAEIYLKGNASEKRSLQKRISTYSSVINNALCKGTVSSQTDEAGRVKPQHFFGEVLAQGGIAAFSRQTEKKRQLKAELKAEGFANERERIVANYKAGMKEGFLWLSSIQSGESCFLSKSLNAKVVSSLGLSELEDFALILVRKNGDKVLAELVSDNQSDVDDFIASDARRRIPEIRKSDRESERIYQEIQNETSLRESELKAVEVTVFLAMERGYNESKLGEFFIECIANKQKWTFSKTERERIAKAQQLAMSRGGVEELLEIYIEHQKGERRVKK